MGDRQLPQLHLMQWNLCNQNLRKYNELNRPVLDYTELLRQWHRIFKVDEKTVPISFGIVLVHFLSCEKRNKQNQANQSSLEERRIMGLILLGHNLPLSQNKSSDRNLDRNHGECDQLIYPRIGSCSANFLVLPKTTYLGMVLPTGTVGLAFHTS